MITVPFVTTTITMLIFAYLGALAVSTAHLSQLYALFNAGLPYWVSIGLAVALEAVAFLFSIISTSLGKRAGPWAAPASTSALLLVWAGNGYAMMLAAPTLKWYVVLAASCFVPVCTLFVGKVLGGLFSLLDELGQQERDAQTQRQQAHRQHQAETVAAPTAVVTYTRTTPVPVIPAADASQIAPEGTGQGEVAQATEPSTNSRNIAASNIARSRPIEVRQAPDHQPVDPVFAVAPMRTDGELGLLLPDESSAEVVPVRAVVGLPDHAPTDSGALKGPESDPMTLLPEASPAEAGPLPEGVNLPGHSPTASGGDATPMGASPSSPGGTRGGAGEAEAQETPKEVTGLRGCTDEALDRVRLNRKDLEKQAGMLKVHAKAKVKAEQRALALRYSQAGVPVTRLAEELDCDESTLRAALKQTKAALQPAEVRK